MERPRVQEIPAPRLNSSKPCTEDVRTFAPRTRFAFVEVTMAKLTSRQRDKLLDSKFAHKYLSLS
jgi:hypothetical protein